jgi:hypothetical protein
MEEHTIVTESGMILYMDTKADLSDKERRLMDLINGAKPMDEEEEEMAQQIKNIQDKGGIVKMPFD